MENPSLGFKGVPTWKQTSFGINLKYKTIQKNLVDWL
jgi:hypothetical protein